MKFRGTPLHYLFWAIMFWAICTYFSVEMLETRALSDWAKAFVSGVLGLYNAAGFRETMKDE